MVEKPIRIGSIVFSKAGRDTGKFFLVTEIVDDSYVKIVDGKLRRLEKPKTKKIKHLKATGDISEKLREKILSEQVIYDAEIYSVIRKYNP